MAGSKIIVNGFTYDWQELQPRLARVRTKLPKAWADAARSFFVDSFRRQGWYRGRTLVKWKPRAEAKTGTGRRRKQRAILIKSGRLRRSIRIRQAQFRRVIIASEAPYAAAHNYGFKGKVKVRGHMRRTYKIERYKYTDKNGRERRSSRKVEASQHYVRGHTRQMNLPKRQFMGDSEILDLKLTAITRRAVDYIFERQTATALNND